MYHRYGRHGPGAWLRWYRRRRKYRSPLPAIAGQRFVFVEIRLTPEAERVLFVMALPQDDEQRKSLQTIPGSIQPPTVLLQPQQASPFRNSLLSYVQSDAEIYANSLIADKLEQEPTDLSIRLNAGNSYNEFVKLWLSRGNTVPSEREQQRQLKDDAIAHYREVVNATLDEAVQASIAPNEDERKLRGIARRDRHEHEASGDVLSQDKVDLLASWRIFQTFPPSTNPTPEDYARVAHYISVYRQYYFAPAPVREVDRSMRSESF